MEQDQGYSMAGGRMTVPGRSEVIGHMMFRCLDCGTEWSGVGDEVGSCPVCLTPELRRFYRRMKGFKMKPIPVEVKKLTEETTLVVSIKEAREFKVRMWLAKRFWIWGARIAGCGIKFDGEDNSVKW